MMREWLSYDLYKKLWSVVGKRHWTYIIRDFYHHHPLIVLFCTLGIGTVLGHIFWGKDWIDGQGKRDLQ